MSRVIVVGSANLDFTVTVERLPAVGETVLGQECYQSFGGKGANQAVAARKAGAEVTFLTKLGGDDHGRRIRDHLAALGFPPEGLLREPDCPTGVALIFVDRAGRNLIAVAPGSNRKLTVEEVRRASGLLTPGGVVLAQLEIPLPAVREAFALAKARGLRTILNPAPAQPLPPEFFRLVDVLTPNEREAEALAGKADPEAAARELLARGAGTVIVTLGERGALWVEARASRLCPSYPVQAVDTTAAGDAFNGALACALAEGRPLDAAIPFANAAGALAATRRGAQDSLPLRQDIERLVTGRSLSGR